MSCILGIKFGPSGPQNLVGSVPSSDPYSGLRQSGTMQVVLESLGFRRMTLPSERLGFIGKPEKQCFFKVC